MSHTAISTGTSMCVIFLRGFLFHGWMEDFLDRNPWNYVIQYKNGHPLFDLS